VKKVFFRFLSLNGQVFSSSNMAYWKNIDIHEMAIKELLRGRSHVFETITIPQNAKRKYAFFMPRSAPPFCYRWAAMESYSRFLTPLRESSSPR